MIQNLNNEYIVLINIHNHNHRLDIIAAVLHESKSHPSHDSTLYDDGKNNFFELLNSQVSDSFAILKWHSRTTRFLFVESETENKNHKNNYSISIHKYSVTFN